MLMQARYCKSDEKDEFGVGIVSERLNRAKHIIYEEHEKYRIENRALRYNSID